MNTTREALIWIRPPIDKPVLTVENCCKWYVLHLLMPDGSIESVDFGQLDESKYCGDGSAYCDHVPNPLAVFRFAEDKSYHLDSQAYEMIVGRWEIEVKGRYRDEP